MPEKMLRWKNLKVLMIKEAYIIGAGGFGQEVATILSTTNIAFAGFIDDDTFKPKVKFDIESFNRQGTRESCLIVAIGSSTVRKAVIHKISADFNFLTIMHPQAIIQDKVSVRIGKGSIICAGSILTCDISLGDFTIVNLNCTIGHDVKIGDFCSLMPSVNLSGNVTLQDGVFIGSGATVLQGITVGEGAVIGAGAVVTMDIPPNCTAVGVPAKPIKFH